MPSIIIFWKAKDLPLNTKVFLKLFLKQFCQNIFPSLSDMFGNMRNIVVWLSHGYWTFHAILYYLQFPGQALHIHNPCSCVLSEKLFAHFYSKISTSSAHVGIMVQAVLSYYNV